MSDSMLAERSDRVLQ